ncbi:MAG: tyrosinase family protein [Myxococcales bacterium]|nr:tyrosinase family protein [Myxococcales bacterium]MCB9748892.1 tyrosinase family protein [Myxococcales bacterium]
MRSWTTELLVLITFAQLAACSGDPGDTDASTSDGGTEGTSDAETSDGTAGTSDAETSDGTEGTSDAETSDGTESTGEIDPIHEMICGQLGALGDPDESYAVPGVAGAPRWGLPPAPPPAPRVRRSWSSLSAADKQQVVDAFLALKSVTVDSGDPGSSRAAYNSFCEDAQLGLTPYAKNLYDFYVEAHINAFVSMRTEQMPMSRMAHMAPQFLPWHRYLLLRLEADMAEAIGDPDFALPYWDWEDCWEDGDPGTCAPIFEAEFLGTAGGCDDATRVVQGYLPDNGFTVNVASVGGLMNFTGGGLVCAPRPIVREVGCSGSVVGPPDAAEIAGIFARPVYDAAPYDSCYTEEDVSFRQYLEGFNNGDLDPICVAAGCTLHGRGHEWIGGDMTINSTPNDPMFFLHHNNVDRMWAAWQEANLASGDAARVVDHGNPGYPEGDYRGPLFVFDEVRADELFEYRALGYEYDALPSE